MAVWLTCIVVVALRLWRLAVETEARARGRQSLMGGADEAMAQGELRPTDPELLAQAQTHSPA